MGIGGATLAAALLLWVGRGAESRAPASPTQTNRAVGSAVTNVASTITNALARPVVDPHPWTTASTNRGLTGTNLLRVLNQHAKTNEFLAYQGTPATLFQLVMARAPEFQVACAAAAFPPPNEGGEFLQRFLPALLALGRGEDSVYVSRNFGIDNRSENNVLWRASTRLSTGFENETQFVEFIGLLKRHQNPRDIAPPVASAQPPPPPPQPEESVAGSGDCFAGGIIGRAGAWRLNVTCTNAITLDGILLTRSRTGERQRHLIPGQECRPGTRLDDALNDYFKPPPEPGDVVELVQHDLVLFTVVVPRPPPSADAADDFSGMYSFDTQVSARRSGRNVPVQSRKTIFFDRASLTARLEMELFDDTLDGSRFVRVFHGEMVEDKVFVGKPDDQKPARSGSARWSDPPQSIKLRFGGETAEVTLQKRTNAETATFTRRVR